MIICCALYAFVFFSVRVLWRVHGHAADGHDRVRGRRRHHDSAGEQKRQVTRHRRRGRTDRRRRGAAADPQRAVD